MRKIILAGMIAGLWACSAGPVFAMGTAGRVDAPRQAELIPVAELTAVRETRERAWRGYEKAVPTVKASLVPVANAMTNAAERARQAQVIGNRPAFNAERDIVNARAAEICAATTC